MMKWRLWATLALMTLLSACGGGSDGCSTGLGSLVGSSALCREESNKSPVADAGASQSVRVGAVVSLDGSFSRDPDGQTLSYQWQWVSKPASSAAVLASGDAAKAAFVADVAGTYVLSLVVSDGKASSLPANVTVTVSAVNAVPVASAGAAQTVVVGQPVMLDGTASTDADRQPITFTWKLISKPAGSAAALTGEATARPMLTPDVPGVYAVSLVVSDGMSNSEPAVTSVTAGVANVAPVARAGVDQNVMVGAVVTLDASASSDANRDPLTYRWTLISKPAGSAASLSAAGDVRPTFTADVAGTYVWSLQVSDGLLSSDFSAVSVVASSINAAPVANAGTDQSVMVGTAVTLDGSTSSDANRDPLTYQWSVVTRPAGSAAALSSAVAVRPIVTPDVPGTYVFSLVVSDGMATSMPAHVVVQAAVINAAPVAQAGVDQSVVVGRVVQLDGSASSDANRDPLTYQWQMVARPPGSTATVSSATADKPTFTAGVVGTYVLSLTVSDGQSASAVDLVVVRAVPDNVPPVAVAGPDQSVALGSSIALSGSASSDADGDSLTYRWSLTSRPVTSAAVLVGETTVSPTFTADVAGVYVVTLIVNDGKVDSLPVTLVVVATP